MTVRYFVTRALPTGTRSYPNPELHRHLWYVIPAVRAAVGSSADHASARV